MSSQAQIVDRTRRGSSKAENDYALSITSTDLGRTINIGSNWTWLRIGVRWALSGSSVTSNTINQPQMAVGLSSGTASLYSTTTTTHFVGVDLDPSYFLRRNVGDNGGIFYSTSTDTFNPGATRRFTVKLQNTQIVYPGTTEYFGINYISGSPERNVVYLDFVKPTSGSGQVIDPGLWLLRYNKLNNVVGDNDISSSTFYTQLSSDTASIAPNTLITQYLPVSESINGHLDTVDIYWNKADPPLEISDVAVWRFA